MEASSPSTAHIPIPTMTIPKVCPPSCRFCQKTYLTPPRVSLLGLPYELREQILKYALKSRGAVELQYPAWSGLSVFNNPLFQISRSLRQESIAAFYEVSETIAQCVTSRLILTTFDLSSQTPFSGSSTSTMPSARTPAHTPHQASSGITSIATFPLLFPRPYPGTIQPSSKTSATCN